jgi:hypothetical protein
MSLQQASASSEPSMQSIGDQINNLELIKTTKDKCKRLMETMAPEYASRLYHFFSNHTVAFNFDAPAAAGWMGEKFVVVCRKEVGKQRFTNLPQYEQIEVKFTREQLEALPEPLEAS